MYTIHKFMVSVFPSTWLLCPDFWVEWFMEVFHGQPRDTKGNKAIEILAAGGEGVGIEWSDPSGVLPTRGTQSAGVSVVAG
jgi:hypothetical protein